MYMKETINWLQKTKYIILAICFPLKPHLKSLFNVWQILTNLLLKVELSSMLLPRWIPAAVFGKPRMSPDSLLVYIILLVQRAVQLLILSMLLDHVITKQSWIWMKLDIKCGLYSVIILSSSSSKFILTILKKLIFKESRTCSKHEAL